MNQKMFHQWELWQVLNIGESMAGVKLTNHVFYCDFCQENPFPVGHKFEGAWGKPRRGTRQSHLNISGNINFNKKPFIAPHKRKHKRILKGFQEGSRRRQDSTHISIILWLTSVFPLFFPLCVPLRRRTAAYL